MGFADQVDAARLRSFVARFLIEAHFETGLEPVEICIEQAVAMKVDLAAVEGPQSATAAGPIEARDDCVRRPLVRLDVAASDALMVLQLAARRLERVAQRHVDVFVSVIRAGRSIGDDLAAGVSQVDTHGVQVALVMAFMRSFDRDATAREVVGDLLELGYALADGIFDSRRSVHLMKNDLQRDLHVHYS